jgi:murein DD-endopeptidase MepM/ murein hydrolase activator NlpD
MQSNGGIGRVGFFVALVAFVFVLLPRSSAEAVTSQQKINQLQQQQAELNKQIQQNQAAANQKKKDAAALATQVDALSSDIDSTQGKINDLTGQIDTTSINISDLEQRIADKQKDLDEQQRNQDETLRVMYETSTDNLLFMIVGSRSISDVIDHNQYLSALEEQIDVTIGQIGDLKKILEADSENLKTKKSEFTGLKAQSEAYQAGLTGEKAQKDALLNQTVIQQKKLQSEVDQAKKLNAQVESELSQIRASLSKGSGPGVVQAKDRGTSSVGFQWPTDYKYISTYFGGSTPFQPSGGHGGIDLANAAGTPIYAAADGTVTAEKRMMINGSYYAYGQYIVIGHNARWSTLYGHLQSFAVSEGQDVKRGQVIGYMGSTGWSTGPHLHFEVWDYSSRVNPLSYLP